MRRCDGEGATHYYHSFAFATLHFRFLLLIQQVSVDYTEFDAGTVLAQSLPINLIYYWYYHALVHHAYYERLLIVLCD